MSSMKYALAMIVAGGAAAAASQASATTVTLNIEADDAYTPIYLVGSDAQYGYGVRNDAFYNGDTVFKGSFLSSPSAKLEGPYYTSGLPSEGETIKDSSYVTVDDKGNFQQAQQDFYLHLKFEDANGREYLGTANFDSFATLKSIDYAGVVPEPESWALLIGGIGLAGAAARRQRRVAAQAAMA